MFSKTNPVNPTEAEVPQEPAYNDSGKVSSPPKSKQQTAPPAASSKVKVKLANTTVYEDRYLVYRVDDIAQVFMVPTEHLEFRVSEQLIEEDLLNRSDKPYSWNDEINAVFPTKDEVRLAVYRNGLVKVEDLLDRQLHQMSLYGAFPTRFKGDS